MRHLWNMGDGGWVEIRKDGKYLCSSYTSTKGFTRGNTRSSEKKLSEQEYNTLLEKEKEWILSIEQDRKENEQAAREKACRVAAYQAAANPLKLDGHEFFVTATGEIRDDRIRHDESGIGNFIADIPRKMPSDEIEARKLLISKIEDANFIE